MTLYAEGAFVFGLLNILVGSGLVILIAVWFFTRGLSDAATVFNVSIGLGLLHLGLSFAFALIIQFAIRVGQNIGFNSGRFVKRKQILQHTPTVENFHLRLPPDYNIRSPEHRPPLTQLAPKPAGQKSQPHLYRFALFMARRLHVRAIIEIGCGDAASLLQIARELESPFVINGVTSEPGGWQPYIIGIDLPGVVAKLQAEHPEHTWIAHDFTQPQPPMLPAAVESVLDGALIVCNGVIEYAASPQHLFKMLRGWLERAAFALVATQDRDRLYGAPHFGPPAEPQRLAEWNEAEFRRLLVSHGLMVDFIGHTIFSDYIRDKATLVAVLPNLHRPDPALVRAPNSFRVVAFIPVFNEIDILGRCIEHLHQHGIECYVVDNWSTDGSYELAQRLQGSGVIGVERFPEDANEPPSLKARMRRIQALTREIRADWFMVNDADEFRVPPWPGVRQKDALYLVDQMGYNCIDFAWLEFPPTDNSFTGGTDPLQHFQYVEFPSILAYKTMYKAWRHFDQPLTLEQHGSHIAFEQGRRTFPYKFLQRHYGIQSQAHGEKKVLGERKPRFHPAERAIGWSTHYDHINENHNFLRDPATLLPAEVALGSDYLLERLAMIGVFGDNG